MGEVEGPVFGRMGSPVAYTMDMLAIPSQNEINMDTDFFKNDKNRISLRISMGRRL
jgi:hypothetical protein